MRPRWRYTPKGVQSHSTFIEVDGIERDITVTYYIQREEADTGTPAGIELDGICYSDGRDAWADITEDQKDQIAITIGEYGDDEGY